MNSIILKNNSVTLQYGFEWFFENILTPLYPEFKVGSYISLDSRGSNLMVENIIVNKDNITVCVKPI